MSWKCVDCGHDWGTTDPVAYDCRVRPYATAGDPTPCGCDNNCHAVPLTGDILLIVEALRDKWQAEFDYLVSIGAQDEAIEGYYVDAADEILSILQTIVDDKMWQETRDAAYRENI